MMKVQVGCSIKDLFCGQFGLNPGYFEERVQTIFLDGNPVDDAGSAVVRAGSHIALSAAMPGLVGAVFRKGGYYSSLRKEISYKEGVKQGSQRDGVVFIKLFNLLLKDLGPDFLGRGIWVEGKDLDDFFKRQSKGFENGFSSALMDGRELGLEQLSTMQWPDRRVFLKVRPCQ